MRNFKKGLFLLSYFEGNFPVSLWTMAKFEFEGVGITRLPLSRILTHGASLGFWFRKIFQFQSQISMFPLLLNIYLYLLFGFLWRPTAQIQRDGDQQCTTGFLPCTWNSNTLIFTRWHSSPPQNVLEFFLLIFFLLVSPFFVEIFVSYVLCVS